MQLLALIAATFVLIFVLNALILFPLPHAGAIYVAGIWFDPVVVLMVAGLASTLGESVGYFIRYIPATYSDKTNEQTLASMLILRSRARGVVLLAMVPNPLFELCGVTAGSLRYPYPTFFAMCFIGKFLRAGLVIAAAQLL